MSQIHPETSFSIPAGPDIASEIQAMNRAFLELLTDPLVAGQGQLLGLDASVVAGLAGLDAEARDRLASAPVLLADFVSLTLDEHHVELIDKVADDGLPPAWQGRVTAYANRLLTALWHFARLDPSLAGFCIGLDQRNATELGSLTFSELNRRAVRLCASLRVRHANHPHCWADLVRFAANGETERLSAALLGLIPLTVATQRAGGRLQAAR